MTSKLSRIVRKHRIGRRRTICDLQAEQAAEQFDRDTCGAAALIQKWIEFDDVDRRHQP